MIAFHHVILINFMLSKLGGYGNKWNEIQPIALYNPWFYSIFLLPFVWGTRLEHYLGITEFSLIKLNSIQYSQEHFLTSLHYIGYGVSAVRSLDARQYGTSATRRACFGDTSVYENVCFRSSVFRSKLHNMISKSSRITWALAYSDRWKTDVRKVVFAKTITISFRQQVCSMWNHLDQTEESILWSCIWSVYMWHLYPTRNVRLVQEECTPWSIQKSGKGYCILPGQGQSNTNGGL